MSNLILSVVQLTFSLCIAEATPIFEGFYQIEIGGNRVGLSAHREELEGELRKTKYLLLTNRYDNSMEEFVQTTEDKNLKPLSYSYQSKVRQISTNITAKCSSTECVFTASSPAGPQASKIPLTDNLFFSSSLARLLAKASPKKGQVYSFTAVVEEEAKVKSGELIIADEQTIGKLRILRILQRFDNAEMEVWMTADGAVLFSRAPKLQLITYLVNKKSDATKDLELTSPHLKEFDEGLSLGSSSLGLKLPAQNLFKGTIDAKNFSKTKRIPLAMVKS
jgi:hypothetical protein